MTRLPQPGSDDGTWGQILNDFLAQAHNADGTLKPLTQSQIQNLTTDLAAKASTASVNTKLNTADLDSQTAALVASSSSTTNSALKAAYVAVPPTLLSGNYYFLDSQGTSSTSNTLGVGTLRLTPVELSHTTSITRIGAEITSAGDAGSKLRLCIYADNGSGYPGSLLLDAGQIAGDSATVQELTVSATLLAGLYWIGAVVQAVASLQPTVRTANIMHPATPIPLGTSIPVAGTAATSLATSGVVGALPASFPAGSGGSGQVVRIFAKIA